MKITCIICPKGCLLEVNDNIVTGNLCKRGIIYGLKEATNPERTLTSTITLISSNLKRLPVKTSKPIKKELIMEVNNELKKITVTPPIKRNQVIVHDILGLGIDIISSRTIYE